MTDRDRDRVRLAWSTQRYRQHSDAIAAGDIEAAEQIAAEARAADTQAERERPVRR